MLYDLYTKRTELSPKEVANRIKQLRSLVLDHQGLNKRRNDDVYLLRYLNCANFDTNLAFQKMINFYEVIANHNEYFTKKSPLESTKLIEQNLTQVIDGQDKDGRLLYIARFGIINPNEVTFKNIIHLSTMWMETLMDRPESQNSGISLILDMKHLSWSIIKWITPTNIRIGSAIFDVNPTREMLIHVVNASMIFNGGLKIAWPFLSTKIKEVLKIHSGDFSTLHKSISPEYLPQEYGGKAPALNFQRINRKLYDRDTEIGKKLRQLFYIQN